MAVTDDDRRFLTRAVDLAETALAAGDEPFGSVLVSPADKVLFEDHNHVASGDHTQHPELAIARWAAANLPAEVRSRCVVYTSGEHCPMCAAAHGWVGLGRIVYASSSAQLAQWSAELGLPPSPVAALPIRALVPDAEVDGPDARLAQRVRDLHQRRATGARPGDRPRWVYGRRHGPSRRWTLMTTTNAGSDGVFEPDPEDWPERDPSEQPAEAVANDADDLSASLPSDETLPLEANEADVIDQRTESGIEDEDEDEPDAE